MYKSGQRMSFDFDTSPLTFDLSGPLTGDYSDEDEDESESSSSASKFDYNVLME